MLEIYNLEDRIRDISGKIAESIALKLDEVFEKKPLRFDPKIISSDYDYRKVMEELGLITRKSSTKKTDKREYEVTAKARFLYNALLEDKYYESKDTEVLNASLGEPIEGISGGIAEVVALKLRDVIGDNPFNPERMFVGSDYEYRNVMEELGLIAKEGSAGKIGGVRYEVMQKAKELYNILLKQGYYVTLDVKKGG